MKKPGNLFIIISLAVVLTDQISKFFIRKLDVGSVFSDLGIFRIIHVQNYGAGFSLLQGHTWLLIIIGFLFLGLVAYYYDKIPKGEFVQSSLALIVGGGIGNLIDRINYGYVIDFLDFKIWPVFNVADSAVTLGAILLIIYMIRNKS